jgi:hypothetical protein
MWVLAGMAVIAAGTALVGMRWAGGPELEVFGALGFSVMTVGVAIVVSAWVT